MAFGQTPVAGVDVTNTIPASLITSGALTVPFAIGTVVNGNDGKLYVFAKANGSISASTAVCTVNASTFLATNSGGSYTSPATAMVVNDYGWFSKASV
jgi:hypothetical protein